MILAIIQARVGSSRLPNKVLLKFGEETDLNHVVNRVKRSKYIDKVVVATTTSDSDQAIEKLCIESDIPFYRGSEPDVLDRFYKCANHFGAKKGDRIVRITADCPLIDAEVIDRVIELSLSENCDYASNVEPPTYPDGLDTEVILYEVLEKLWEITTVKSDREHVTLYIRTHKEEFSTANHVNDQDISSLRWTLDEPEDYDFIKIIYNALLPKNKYFDRIDILRFLSENPDIASINSKFYRNEGLTASLAHD